jgi:hypothetical protein
MLRAGLMLRPAPWLGQSGIVRPGSPAISAVICPIAEEIPAHGKVSYRATLYFRVAVALEMRGSRAAVTV